jgi:hypothetical protein
MIHESRFWKNDLLKSALSLEGRLTQRRWSDGTFADVEKRVMLGFYAIRKLIEAKKIDDKVANQSAALTIYRSSGKPVTRLNWHRYEELYDLTSPQISKLELLLVCHQFVHSYVFSCSFSQTHELVSVLVSSDRSRNGVLYEVQVLEVIRIFREIGQNYPSEYKSTFNARKGDYDVAVGAAKSEPIQGKI